MSSMRTRGGALLLSVALASGCSHPPQESQHKETATTMPTALETVLQMTLDSDGLTRYFHEDTLPERKPLRVLANNVVPSTVRLQKFGQPVLWTAVDDAGGKPVIEFTSVTVEADTAAVAFRYSAEGIRGTLDFQKHGKTWAITGSRIVEN